MCRVGSEPRGVSVISPKYCAVGAVEPIVIVIVFDWPGRSENVFGDTDAQLPAGIDVETS